MYVINLYVCMSVVVSLSLVRFFRNVHRNDMLYVYVSRFSLYRKLSDYHVYVYFFTRFKIRSFCPYYVAAVLGCCDVVILVSTTE